MLANNLRRKIKNIQTIAQRSLIFAAVLALSLGTLSALPLKSFVAHAAGSYIFSGVLATQTGTKLSSPTLSIIDQSNNVFYATINTSTGSFSISAPPGMYSLRLFANYSSQSNAGPASFTLTQSSSNPTIDLTAGDKAQNLTLNVATVRTKAYNAQNYPAVGVKVTGRGQATTTLYPGDPGMSGPVNSNSGDADGNGGAYMTSIVGTTYNSGSLCVPAGCNPQPVTVTGDMNVDVPQTPPAPYTFTGALYQRSNGSAIPSVSVTLTDQYQNRASAVTDVNGRFTVKAQAGMYALGINGSNLGSLGSFTIQQPSTNPTIDLTTGNQTLNLTLPDTPIRFTAYNAQGYKAVGVRLTGNASGTAKLYPSDPGSAIMQASISGNSNVNGDVFLNGLVGSTYTSGSLCVPAGCITQPVNVVDNMNVDVPKSPPAPNTFSGTLTTNTGTKLSGASVTLIDQYQNQKGVSTDGNGNFTISAQPGMYALRVIYSKGTDTGLSNFELQQPTTSPTIDLTTGNRVQNLTINTANVTAYVLDAYGNFVSNYNAAFANASSGTASLYPDDPGTKVVSIRHNLGNAYAPCNSTFTTIVGTSYQTNSIYANFSNSSNVQYLTTPFTVNGTSQAMLRDTSLGTPLPSPLNFTIPSPTNKPVLTWDPVAGAVSYKIYRNCHVIGTTTSTTFTDTSTNGAETSYMVSAVDTAGIASNPSQSVNIVLDILPPAVSATWSRQAVNGWYNGPVTITITCTDPYGKGDVKTCTPSEPVTFATDGANQQLAYMSTDYVGNVRQGTITVNVDQTPPALGTPSWSGNPALIGTSATLTVPVTDATSGVAAGEYYIGNTDPGVGKGTIMTLSGGNLTTAIGANLPAGVYDVHVRAKDKAENWSDVATTKLAVGVFAPNGLSAASPTETPQLSWSGISGATSYNIYRDGTLIGSATSTNYTDNTAPEGSVKYYVTSVNANGESLSSNVITVVVDRTAPTISPDISPNPNASGWITSLPATVSFDCADSGSGVQSCTDPVTLTQDGTYIVTGTAVDKLGHMQSINVYISIDTTRPTITFTAASNGWVNTDGGVPYTCANDDGTTSQYTAPIVTGPDGQTTATGTCTDQAGNTSTQVIPVKVDTATPTVDYHFSQPTNALGWSTGPVTVTFDCQDPDGGAVGSASGIAFCSEPVTVTAEGTTVVTGIARDVAGNYNEVNVFVSIDSVKPTLTYTKTPADPNANDWYNTDVTINFTCSDEPSDKASGVAVCPQPITVKNDGAQTITATARDIAGNTQTVEVPVKLDKTVPDITATVTPDANAQQWHNTTPVTVTFNCSDATSGVDTCTSPVTLTEDGVYIVTGKAVDNAGNIREINVTVQVDSTAPMVSNASFAVNPKFTTDATATLTAEVADPAVNGSASGIASVEYFDPVQQAWLPMTLNGSSASVTINTPAETYTAGTYTFQVRTTDNAGNVSTAASASLLILDPNQAPIINALTGGTITEGGAYNENGTYSDPDSTLWTATVDYGDGSGTQPLPLSGVNFALGHTYQDEGTYTVTVAITDGQGATGTMTTNITVTNVAPSISVITASNNPITVGSSTTASATFTDPGTTDTHTAVWDWGDGTTPETVIPTESNGSGSVTGTHIYSQVGYFTITLTITDNDGAVSIQTFHNLTVYNPESQITGSRLFTSPSGSYQNNTSLSGQTSFSLTNVRYVNGQPAGSVGMTFSAANLKFDSSSISDLVVANGVATIRGTGTINGTGSYTFRVTTTAGAGAQNPAKIRFQIKDSAGQIVYDSQPGAEETATPIATVTGAVTIKP